MDSTNDKVILKRSELPGIDMSLVDLEIVGTVKVRVTVVKKKMYTVKSKTFIGTRDQLDTMDIIQAGNLGIKYRVMGLEKMTDREGYIYRIKRLDGYNTTPLDTDATAVGQKVSIVNRQSFEQLFAYACSMREEIPVPTTVDLSRTLACEGCGVKTSQSLPEPEIPVIPEPECPPEGCTLYSFLSVVGLLDNGTFQYINCNGEMTTWDINVDPYTTVVEGTISVYVCGTNGQDFSSITLSGDIVEYMLTIPTCGICDTSPSCTQQRITSNPFEIVASLYIACDGFLNLVTLEGEGDGQGVIDICTKAGSEFIHLQDAPLSIVEIGNC